MTRASVLLLLLFAVSLQALPQAKATDPSLPDSLLEKQHSPTRATIYSAVLPGLGQIYNRKYWKVPVIYAGIGVLTYFIVTNTENYMDYRCAYIEKVNGATNGNYSDLVNKYSQENLLSAAEYYRRNLEISILLSALWYIMNILDATVDAHLYTYNISKDLSLRAGPALLQDGPAGKFQPGLQLTFKIK